MSDRNLIHAGRLKEKAENTEQDKGAVGRDKNLHTGKKNQHVCSVSLICSLSKYTLHFTLYGTVVALVRKLVVTHWFHLAHNTNIPFVYLFPSIFQTQVNDNEKVIKEEFQKLHQFLHAEENIRLKALKQEEQIKTQVMCEKLKNISRQITTLSSTITEIETALSAKDLTFLQVQ